VIARIIRVLRYAGRAIILAVAFLYFLIDFIFFRYYALCGVA
jgi:hypothetical protein